MSVTIRGSDVLFNDGTTQSTAAIGVRAWVSYKGVTQTIKGSYNVSSVTYNSTGIYTINFSSAMPHANYAVITGNTGASTSESSRLVTVRSAGSQNSDPYNKTTTSVSIISGYGWSGGSFDTAEANIAIFA